MLDRVSKPTDHPIFIEMMTVIASDFAEFSGPFACIICHVI